ncbi:MAG: acyl-CoA dehydrogenase family protein, partial [Pseudonocardia sp.]|nr:acyl-CoA dehydrogenase family protein [Pseudonocardia sp.]
MPSTDPWLTDERRALRALVADFTTREIVPHLPEWETDGELPRQLHKKAAHVG